jgi:two-component system OmpR family sensor kinase
MGRLFWKCFLATWITLNLAGAVILTSVHLYRTAGSPAGSPRVGPKATFELDMAEAVLRHAQAPVLATLLRDLDSPMLVLDPSGQDIRDKTPSDEQRALLSSLTPADPRPGVRWVHTTTGTYLLMLSLEHGGPFPDVAHPGPPPGHRPTPWEPLAFGLLASATLSALLAWYLARPIKRLRAAFADMASGRLDTRVGTLMRRGDEIADLGREFDAMAAKLQHLIQAQRQLLHDVSHELRSPLNRLQAVLGIVRQDPSKLQESTLRMEREVERLDELIGEILTLARLQSGMDRDKEDMVDLGELIGVLVEDARFEATIQGISVRLTERGSLLVPGVPRLLSRAVENVIRNGLKYSSAGGELDVDVEGLDSRVVIRVRDHGPGIPADELDTVFEPFRRGTKDTERDGFGLGLAIAKGAVNLHNGTITARNMADGGLCMEISLPARQK